jgi:hypothetical protein
VNPVELDPHIRAVHFARNVFDVSVGRRGGGNRMVAIRPVLRLNMSGCGVGADKALEADRYQAALDMAEYADNHGFAIVNVEEHHDVEIGGVHRAGDGLETRKPGYGVDSGVDTIGGVKYLLKIA